MSQAREFVVLRQESTASKRTWFDSVSVSLLVLRGKRQKPWTVGLKRRRPPSIHSSIPCLEGYKPSNGRCKSRRALGRRRIFLGTLRRSEEDSQRVPQQRVSNRNRERRNEIRLTEETRVRTDPNTPITISNMFRAQGNVNVSTVVMMATTWEEEEEEEELLFRSESDGLRVAHQL